jgi:hypothetical protein
MPITKTSVGKFQTSIRKASSIVPNFVFGKNALEVTQVASNNSGIRTPNLIAVSPSTTYTFSYYVKPGSGNSSIDLATIVHDVDSGGTNIVTQHNTTNTTYYASDGWKRVVHTFTTHASAAFVRLHICYNTYPVNSQAVVGSKFVVDGIMLEQSSTVNKFKPNLVSNSSFETDASGWNLLKSSDNVSATLQTSSTYSLYGSNSLKLSVGSTFTPATSYAFANLITTLVAGTYSFSAYVYSPVATTVKIAFRDNDGVSYDGASDFVVPANTWTRISKPVVQVGANAYWSIGFDVGQVVANSNLYIDGVKLETSSTVSAYNLIPNESFETDTTGWDVNATGVTLTLLSSPVSSQDVCVANRMAQRLATRKVIIADIDKTKTYKATRPMIIGNTSYAVGDVVPGAANWVRVETWIKARWIEEVDL